MFIDMKEIDRIGGLGRNPDIAAALRTLELNKLVITDITDEMVNRALSGFDTGIGDPNDYRKRMHAALEAVLKN